LDICDMTESRDNIVVRDIGCHIVVSLRGDKAMRKENNWLSLPDEHNLIGLTNISVA